MDIELERKNRIIGVAAGQRITHALPVGCQEIPEND